MAKKSRPDSERRLRQGERLARLLRTLQLIMGKGRWDADSLAGELECSRRTVYRLLHALSLAGVPWHFDTHRQCYQVRDGFRFPILDTKGSIRTPEHGQEIREMQPLLQQVLGDGQKFQKSLDQFLGAVRKLADPESNGERD